MGSTLQATVCMVLVFTRHGCRLHELYGLQHKQQLLYKIEDKEDKFGLGNIRQRLVANPGPNVSVVSCLVVKGLIVHHSAMCDTRCTLEPCWSWKTAQRVRAW